MYNVHVPATCCLFLLDDQIAKHRDKQVYIILLNRNTVYSVLPYKWCHTRVPSTVPATKSWWNEPLEEATPSRSWTWLRARFAGRGTFKASYPANGRRTAWSVRVRAPSRRASREVGVGVHRSHWHDRRLEGKFWSSVRSSTAVCVCVCRGGGG